MASPSYPHPKLLGSLKGMLGNHHRNGMGVDTLLFDAVRADDPSVSGEEYVDVPSGSFPKVNGADLWWQDLPPEGEYANSGLHAVSPLDAFTSVPSKLAGGHTTHGPFAGRGAVIECASSGIIGAETEAEAGSIVCDSKRHSSQNGWW